MEVVVVVALDESDFGAVRGRGRGDAVGRGHWIISRRGQPRVQRKQGIVCARVLLLAI
jgi:hypothetical protein